MSHLKLVKSDTKDYHYDIVWEAGLYVINRYEVKANRAQYICIKEIKLCIISEVLFSRFKVLSKAKPKKFFFDYYYRYADSDEDLGLEDKLIVDNACHDDVEIVSFGRDFDEGYKAEVASRMSDFIWKLPKKGVLVTVPKEWFNAFEIHYPSIERLLLEKGYEL